MRNPSKDYSNLSKRPIMLLRNRVWRTYSGGRRIEEWQGLPDPDDSEFPEEWVSSTVKAINVGREHMTVEGFSHLQLADGETVTLKEIIELDPEAFLGKKHVEKYGSDLAVLVKVLDSSERLTIQVHPDRSFARQMFDSEFGKTEAWFVLGGREINGIKPHLLFGFKPGMTREKWKSLFEEQDTHGMINSLHQITLNEGDVYLVEGGVPHAIGSGCFLIEIQEPTDLTFRVERMTPKNNPVPDLACHQGIGFDQMLNCFHYESYTLEETLQKWKMQPRVVHETQGGREIELIGSKDTDRFRMHSIHVKSKFSYLKEGAFAIAIVLKGEGKMTWSGIDMDICASDQIFIPIEVSHLQWININHSELEIVLCFPPG